MRPTFIAMTDAQKQSLQAEVMSSGVSFINILQAAFSHKSLFRSFLLLMA